MDERGFAKLPPEIRNMVYDHLSSFDRRLVVVIPNPHVRFLPEARWSVPQHIAWRIPDHVQEPAVEISGLTAPHWLDLTRPPCRYPKADTRLPRPMYLLCREFHQQALEMYYQSLTFGFWSVEGFQTFLHRIPPLAAANIRSLIVEISFDVPGALVNGEDGVARSFFQSWQAAWETATEKLLGLDALGVQINLHTPAVNVREGQHVQRETALHNVHPSQSIAAPLSALQRMAAKKCRIEVLITHHFEESDKHDAHNNQSISSSGKRDSHVRRWSRSVDIPASWAQEVSFTRDLIIANKAISLLSYT